MAVNNITHTPNTVKLRSLTVATVTVLSAGNEVSKIMLVSAYGRFSKTQAMIVVRFTAMLLFYGAFRFWICVK